MFLFFNLIFNFIVNKNDEIRKHALVGSLEEEVLLVIEPEINKVDENTREKTIDEVLPYTTHDILNENDSDTYFYLGDIKFIRSEDPDMFILDNFEEVLAILVETFMPGEQKIEEHSEIHTVFFPLELLYIFLFFLLTIIILAYFSKIHTNLLVLLILIELITVIIGIFFGTLVLFDIQFADSQVYSIALLALSAAEAVVGLSLILLYFRASRGSIDISKEFFHLNKKTNNQHQK